MRHSILFSGMCWRMKFVAEAKDILGPARAAEGRSHYAGQRAIYLSTSPEGTVIATRRYMQPRDPPRAIFPIQVENAHIVDLRDSAATAALGIDTRHRAAEWQPIRARGLPSPTWEISDRVRLLGLDGMLYASRSEPDLTHLTLFKWNMPGSARLVLAGSPSPWPDRVSDGP